MLGKDVALDSDMPRIVKVLWYAANAKERGRVFVMAHGKKVSVIGVKEELVMRVISRKKENFSEKAEKHQ